MKKKWIYGILLSASLLSLPQTEKVWADSKEADQTSQSSSDNFDEVVGDFDLELVPRRVDRNEYTLDLIYKPHYQYNKKNSEAGQDFQLTIMDAKGKTIVDNKFTDSSIPEKELGKYTFYLPKDSKGPFTLKLEQVFKDARKLHSQMEFDTKKFLEKNPVKGAGLTEKVGDFQIDLNEGEKDYDKTYTTQLRAKGKDLDPDVEDKTYGNESIVVYLISKKTGQLFGVGSYGDFDKSSLTLRETFRNMKNGEQRLDGEYVLVMHKWMRKHQYVLGRMNVEYNDGKFVRAWEYKASKKSKDSAKSSDSSEKEDSSSMDSSRKSKSSDPTSGSKSKSSSSKEDE